MTFSSFSSLLVRALIKRVSEEVNVILELKWMENEQEVGRYLEYTTCCFQLPWDRHSYLTRNSTQFIVERRPRRPY